MSYEIFIPSNRFSSFTNKVNLLKIVYLHHILIIRAANIKDVCLSILGILLNSEVYS